MAYLVVDKDGTESIHEKEPMRVADSFWDTSNDYKDNLERLPCDIFLPKGTIKKIIGKNLTWEDEPFKLPDE